MVLVKTAPYGEWKSQISAEAVAADSRPLTSPRVCSEAGRTFYLEPRTDITNGIVELTSEGPRQILPIEYSADAKVYEYGGLAYSPIPGEQLRIIFNDSARKSLNILDVDSGTMTAIKQSSSLQYTDFDCHPEISSGAEECSWVLAVEEDYAQPRPEDMKNHLVAINLVTNEIRRVVEGTNFISQPIFSPAGCQVAWLERNHHALPFVGVKLYAGDFEDATASITNIRHIAGENDDSITELRWSPDGDLYFCSDATGFRQLSRIRNGARERILLPGLEEADFGPDGCAIGHSQSYVFLTEDTIVAAPVHNGKHRLVYIDLETQDWSELHSPLIDLRGLAPLSPTAFIAVGSGYTATKGIYEIEILENLQTEITLVRSSVEESFPETLFSKPVPIRFTTLKAPHREVHGFFWPPHNPRYMAPEGDRPPFIVVSNGGPAGHKSPGLNMRQQYFTSRGYAYFAINYTGTSVHGKAYREGIFEEWGIPNRDDVAEAVDYLSWSGRVDRERPAIFAGGVSCRIVSDLRNPARKTHKQESRYYLELLLNLGNQKSEERAELLAVRRPLQRAERISTPLLLGTVTLTSLSRYNGVRKSGKNSGSVEAKRNQLRCAARRRA